MDKSTNEKDGFVIVNFDEDILNKILEGASQGNIQDKLNIIIHNQGILNERIKKLLGDSQSSTQSE